MAKEILLYGGFFQYAADQFIKELEAAKGENIIVRLNSEGGDPQDSFGMISKFQSHEGEKMLKIDGKAWSTGAYFPCYVDDSEALDVSEFIFHRAAFSSYIENNPEYFTDEDKSRLQKVNDDLRAALEGKVDVAKFERVTGVTMDQLFSMDGRIEVTLDANQAKKVGLIDRVVKITPEIRKNVNANISKMSAYIPEAEAEKPKEVTPKEKENPGKIMDLNTFKAEHPSLYAQAVQEGITKGMKQENQRISAYLVFADVDLEAVKTGIASTEAISPVQMAEFTRKSVSAEILKDTQEGAPGAIDTKAEDDKVKTEKDKELSSFEATVKSNLGLKVEEG